MEANHSNTAKTITLILVDWQGYETRRNFLRSQSQLRRFGWIPKVVFADSKFSDVNASGDDVADLIRKSSSELIAIVDEGFIPEKHMLTWLANIEGESEFHSIYHRNRARKSSTNFFLFIYSLLTKLLFRTNKTRFKPGAVVFKRRSKYVEWVSGSTDFSSTRLLAMARLNGCTIHETEMSPRTEPIQPIKTRHVIEEISKTIRCWWNEIMFPNTASQPGSPSKFKTPTHTAKWWGWSALVAATIVVFAMNLDYPLFEPDESRNAQLGLNILQSGEWHTLTLAGNQYWDKPPLLAWCTALSFQTLGVSEFAARLPGSLAAIFTVLLTVGIGWRLIGFRAALISGFMLLGSCAFVFSGRFITMDAGLTMCSTIVLLAGYLAIFRQQFSLRWWVLAGAAAGVGMLIKGPVIVVLTLPPLIAASWLAGNRTLLRPRYWIWFTAMMTMIAGPWYIAMSLVYPEFLSHFFWKHHVVRYADAFNHAQPFWYYLLVVFIGMFPASLLIPTLLRKISTRKADCRAARPAQIGFLLISAGWIIGFFSLSQSKLPNYILPAYPMICLMLGWMIDSTVFARESRLPQWLKIVPIYAGALLTLLIVLMQLVLLFWFEETKGMLIFTCVIPAILFLIWKISSRNYRRPHFAWSGLALIAVVFSIYGVGRLAPKVAEARSIHVAALKLQSQPGSEDSPIVFFGHEDYGATLQIPRNDVISFTPQQMNSMCEYLYDHPDSIIVSTDEVMQNLRVALDWHIDLHKLGHRHLYTSNRNNIRSARLKNIERRKASRTQRR